MAEIEINISKPYFELLGRKITKKNLRNSLIQNAQVEFFNVLTQIVRHILNGTFLNKNSEQFENSFYIIALPSTTIKQKKIILVKESYKFFEQLFAVLLEISE